MKNILIATALVVICNQASANTLTFDDLPTPNEDGSLITSYQGFYIDSYIGSRRSGYLGYIDPTPFLTPGVDYTGFNNNIIFNPYGFEAPNQMIFSKIGIPFDFNGGFWSAGVTGDATISFEGYRNSSRVQTSGDYLLQRDVVTPIMLSWFGIDYLIINSSAAIWVADNLEFDSKVSSVPVPAAIWLLGTAILGFAGFRRKSM